MNIKTALAYMPDLEKVCKIEEERVFCNADETINTISVYSMRKQLPVKPKVMLRPLKSEKYWWYCGSCGASRHTNSRSHYCSYCGQRVDWSEYLQNLGKDIPADVIEEAKITFPEVEFEVDDERQNDRNK